MGSAHEKLHHDGAENTRLPPAPPCPGLREALLALAFSSAPTASAEPQDLVSLVRNRSQDDKAVVRKAALQVRMLGCLAIIFSHLLPF